MNHFEVLFIGMFRMSDHAQRNMGFSPPKTPKMAAKVLPLSVIECLCHLLEATTELLPSFCDDSSNAATLKNQSGC